MTIKMKYKKRTNYRFLLTELLTNICFYVLNEKFKLVVTFDKNIITRQHIYANYKNKIFRITN